MSDTVSKFDCYVVRELDHPIPVFMAPNLAILVLDPLAELNEPFLPSCVNVLSQTRHSESAGAWWGHNCRRQSRQLR